MSHESETPGRLASIGGDFDIADLCLLGALSGRDNTNRACGILMERHGLSAEQALRELLRRARTDGTPLSVVCSGLIDAVRMSADS